MSKSKSTEIAKPMPAFLQNTETGTENLSQYIRPPVIKVVQKQASDSLLEKFDIGTPIMSPQLMPVAAKGEPFVVVPIYFFPEWIKTSPYLLKEQFQRVVERSRNPASEIAKKARDRVEEPVPGHDGHSFRYVEVLNFVCMLPDIVEFAETPMVFPFMRSEWRTGSNLCAKIKMRNCALFGCRFEMKTTQRSNNKGQWYGFEIENADEPFVTDAELFGEYEALHKLYANADIEVDHEDEEDEVKEDRAF